MGFYLETGTAKGKADYLIKHHDAVEIPSPPRWYIPHREQVMVCVVDNGLFEAAGVAYTKDEMVAFLDPRDDRPKRWLSMDKIQVQALSPHVPLDEPWETSTRGYR